MEIATITQAAWNIITAIIGVFFGFGILVFVHELGHFLAAKWTGIKVEAFALGFGPKIIGTKRGETEYRFNWIPFGGYVKLAGMEGEDGKSPQDIEGGFYAATPWKRNVTIAAGACFNFIFAVLVFLILSQTGIMQPDETPIIGAFEDGYPAAESGLEIGDRILSINGKPVKKFTDVVTIIAFANTDEFTFKIDRSGEVLEIPIKSKKDSNVGAYRVGIYPMERVIVDTVVAETAADKMGLKPRDEIESVAGEPIYGLMPFKKKLKEHIGESVTVEVLRGEETKTLTVTVPEPEEGEKIPILGFAPDPFGKLVREYPTASDSVGKTFGMVYNTLKRLLAFGSKVKISASGLSGPLGIIRYIRATMLVSLSYYFWFLAFLSMNLGIVNLLPIPVLDGGHILFTCIESIRRKPLNEKVMAVITNVFVTLIIAFFLYVTFHDTLRLFRGGSERVYESEEPGEAGEQQGEDTGGGDIDDQKESTPGTNPQPSGI